MERLSHKGGIDIKHRIHIFGASGSGASTLGQVLLTKLPHVNLDGDDYFWIEKFTTPREPLDRLKRLTEDLNKHQQWILSGAVCGWGDRLKPLFDLVIFLHVPNEIRLERLRTREALRYGDAILPEVEACMRNPKNFWRGPRNMKTGV